MSSSYRIYSQQVPGNQPLEDAGEADLSLSELSLNEKPVAGPSHRFSLLAQPLRRESPKITGEEEDAQAETGTDENEQPEQGTEAWQRSVARSREDRLRQDLFVLQKLNASLSLYNDALGEVETSNERAAVQLQKTDALLNKYINILEKSETATKLIFDERWQGAEDDEITLERERLAAEEAERKRAEEKALAEERERARREKEDREKREKDEKERLEAEKREKLALRAGYGGVRGVRGTRASAARARGAAAARASALPVRGRTSTVAPTTTSSGGRYSRPASSASLRSTTSVISSRSNAR